MLLYLCLAISFWLCIQPATYHTLLYGILHYIVLSAHLSIYLFLVPDGTLFYTAFYITFYCRKHATLSVYPAIPPCYFTVPYFILLYSIYCTMLYSIFLYCIYYALLILYLALLNSIAWMDV